MIVYVESNFVLEIALEQKESAEAKAILALAESGKLQLSFPNFALSEPFTSVNFRYIDSFTHGLNYLQRKLRDEEA